MQVDDEETQISGDYQQAAVIRDRAGAKRKRGKCISPNWCDGEALLSLTQGSPV